VVDNLNPRSLTSKQSRDSATANTIFARTLKKPVKTMKKNPAKTPEFVLHFVIPTSDLY